MNPAALANYKYLPIFSCRTMRIGSHYKAASLALWRARHPVLSLINWEVK